MKLTSYEDLVATPWKNGGGVTRELACYPVGAAFDDFLWRVSIADVGLSGPFSCFPGIDRIITLLGGAGMELNFADGRTHALTAPFIPYRFAGEERVDAELVGAGCQDFNLMLRRGAVSGEVVVWHVAGTLADASDFLLLFSARGQWEVSTADGNIIILAPQQTLSADAGVVSVRPANADCALIIVKIKLQDQVNLMRQIDSRQGNGIWHNARIAPAANPYDIIEDGAIVVRDGTISWIGHSTAMPSEFAGSALPRHDVGRQWITPGLIDCHTHLVYGGTRADEFALRLAGASYEEIARQGGGIVSTVHATRAADEDSLFRQAARRLEALMAEGVTAIEIKSGYGLDLETERKMLCVARRLGDSYPVSVYTTFLGAHALPPEYKDRADDYITLVCETMMPKLYEEGLVDAVDVFCESIGFSVEQSERVFNTAGKLGLPVKMHADQLSNMGGSQLAASYRALSVDHLEYLSEADIVAIKQSGSVAVLLPGAYYFIRETKLPPIALLRQYDIPIAISTDSNPGSSPTTSLLLMLNMSCTLFRLTVAEALMGVTGHAARAIGKADRHGLLAVGRSADFAIWGIDSLAELAYWSGFNPCSGVVRAGIVTRRQRTEQ